MDDETYYDDEFADCSNCEEEQESGYAYPHCCGCGADGSTERPDCTCDA